MPHSQIMQKTVLVTGATSGFGKAIAIKFASNGYAVCITGRRKDRLDELKDELERAYNVPVHALCFDVRNRQEVAAAVDALRKEIDTVDILVNNAGLAAGLATIDEADVDDWDQMIDTNVKGLLYITNQVLPLIKNSKAGHIINIGSTAGKTVYKFGNVYCATKFAVDALTQGMRIDLLPYGIKVTAINPGMAETEFSLVRLKGDEVKAKAVYEDKEPLTAEDIADIAYYTATLPPHVCINDLTVTCLNQANSTNTIKNSERINRK